MKAALGITSPVRKWIGNRLLQCVALFLCFYAAPTVSQEKSPQMLTLQEMKNLAKKLTRAQVIKEEFNMLYEFLSRDSLVIPNKQNLFTMYDEIESDDIGCTTIQDSTSWNGFAVFRCSRSFVFHGSSYVIAMGYDGSVFFLQGFHQTDFDKLLRYKIGSINSIDQANDIAKLYLNTVFFVKSRHEFIDEVNIRSYQSIFPTLSRPRWDQKEDGFEGNFFTITKGNDDFGRATFEAIKHFIYINHSGHVDHREISREKEAAKSNLDLK